MNKEEIKAYQDSAYDVLKQLPKRINNCGCMNTKDVLNLIDKTLKAMDKMSTRKLGLNDE